MMGGSCGTVGRAVASDTKGSQFDSSRQQILYLCTINCVEKAKIKKKALFF